jgi:Tfp pilus assembly protein PilF
MDTFDRRFLWHAFSGFLAIGLLVYGYSLWNDFVRWDDGMLIFENAAIRAINPSTIRWIFTHFDPELYIPVTFLSYQADYQIWGQNPFGYHLTSLLLHVVGSTLLAAGVGTATGKRGLGMLCGLLFLLHPLHTEAVAWASGRKDVLSGAFFCGSVLLYLRWLHTDRRAVYVASLLLFLLGLLSKVMVATLPAILVLLDLGMGRGITRRSLIEKIPYAVLSLVLVIVAFVGKEHLVAQSSMAVKIFMSVYSAVFYLGKIMLPRHFSVLYPFDGTIDFTSLPFLGGSAILLALLALAAFSWRYNRWVTVGILWYFIMLGPTFVNIGVKGEMDMYFASDRYAYLPSVGIFIAAVAFVAPWIERFSRSVQRGLVLVVLVILGILAIRQSLVWRDTESLFGNVLAYYPASSHVAHNNLGNVYRLEGDLDRSIDEYKQALAIREHAKTWSNLGAAYRLQRMYPEALDAYAKALAKDPGSPYAHFGLGLVQQELGQWGEARSSFEKAAQLLPDYEEVYVALGNVLEKQGDLGGALREYENALVQNELMPNAHYNRSVILAKLGRNDEALEGYLRTISLAPQMTAARINAGLLLHAAGRLDEAARQFREILQYDAQNKAARKALQQMGVL